MSWIPLSGGVCNLINTVDNKQKFIYNYSMRLKLMISCLRHQEGVPYERKNISNYI
jgi:hypothetical protein